MNTSSGLPLQALPDGEAEVAVILHLTWEDVAALGREASRLATRLKRPVGLDEAASYRLRGRPATATAGDRGPALAPPPADSPGRAAVESNGHSANGHSPNGHSGHAANGHATGGTVDGARTGAAPPPPNALSARE